MRPTMEDHAGVYEIEVYAKDYVINERLLDTFTVNVLGYKSQVKIEKKKVEEGALSVKFKEVKDNSKVVLEFSKDLI